ncbi:MAG: preprotein translocase subunit YajC [Oscillospiraceae bacterium]|jgi:preprotein translocase subunit YajC|nr:preprotein translocase subunit YajC [Oscillospiraceae bacterium]
MINNWMILTTVASATEASGELPPGEGTGALLIQIGFFAVVAVLFYFIIIKPQKKRERETKDMRDSIQVGDEVVTEGGIVGLVLKKTEDTVLLETGGDRNKVRVKLWAIKVNVTAMENADRG